ncbi:MAG: ferritin family protein, partial [Desulfobacteraceae bacterium]
PDTDDKGKFEAQIVSEVMEGGFTTEAFLEQNKAAMQTTEGVLNIAMMLETQALDLYMRYSQKAQDEKNKYVLNDIAEDEKGHLAALGRLVEARVSND